jgi:arsenate reductase
MGEKMSYIYYHNPKCSKSRAGLEFIQQLNIDFTIKEYLKEPLSEAEVLTLFTRLGDEVSQIIRTKEDIYKALGLKGKELSNRELAHLIIENPRLLERPILCGPTRACIGRPTDNLKNATE